MVEIRSAYSPRKRVSISFEGEGLTRQSFKKECDVNSIMAKYAKTGLIDHVSRVEARYGDFTGAPSSYLEAMQTVIDGQTAFAALPASLRKEFDNDPALFLQFMSDPANVDRMRELKLLPSKPKDTAKNAVGDDPAPTPPSKPKASVEPEKPA